LVPYHLRNFREATEDFLLHCKIAVICCFIQGFFDNVSKHGPALGYMQWEVPLLSEWLQVRFTGKGQSHEQCCRSLKFWWIQIRVRTYL
jgi:hypothetical protein